MDDKKIDVMDDEENLEFSAISRLVDLGHKKSYVTIDDILHYFPEAEQDVAQLEEVFAALMAAGIPYMDDDDLTPEPSKKNYQKMKLRRSSKRSTRKRLMILST